MPVEPKALLALLISPQGRIARTAFWLGFLIVMVASTFVNAVPGGQILGLALVWPQLAVHIKRLHDMGWSGWLLLLPIGTSVACLTLMVLTGGTPLLTASPAELAADLAKPELRVPSICLEVSFAVEVAFLFWVGLTKGQPEANRFGPVPNG
ncbi:MAG TPA: DUF805 domain-containing protein [Rhizomicrobium sp.]|nr:DUF805 domain-containing protein [Rhizomicrobium sp.]